MGKTFKRGLQVLVDPANLSGQFESPIHEQLSAQAGARAGVPTPPTVPTDTELDADATALAREKARKKQKGGRAGTILTDELGSGSLLG